MMQFLTMIVGMIVTLKFGRVYTWSGWGPSLRDYSRMPEPKSEFVKKGQWVFLIVMIILLGLTLYVVYKGFNG